ncbi:MAG TPA: polysaccharide deacetylase family protein [Nitrososphaerales archaeon]|nr:polysaccharide deacetylase family protein [Nitrososphaerales archaeon]
MGIHLKRTAKALVLDAAASPVLSSSGSLTRATLQRLNIGFEPSGSVLRTPWPERAAACVSVDFDVTQPGREGPNHTGTLALLELSEKYGIPLTWAICGKTAVEDPEAYSRILDSEEEQEIGVHTYSHIDASISSADQLEAEIAKCVSVLGLPSAPITFVFPWNREAHFDVLQRMGFKAYRGKQRVIGGLSRDRGLWNIPPVYYVDQKSVGAAPLMKRYVDICVRHRAVFHLWTHPWSIVEEGGSSERMVRTALEPVFAYMAQKRDEGLLHTGTMGSLATVLEGDRKSVPSIPTSN